MPLEKPKINLKIFNKRLHSQKHVLADELSLKMREPKKFAAYLGIAKLYEESDLRALARRVSEKKYLPPEARGKYFFASLKNLVKKTGVSFKSRKKKILRKRRRRPERKRVIVH